MNKLTAIACMASNRVIGAKGAIPWHHPADLRFFRARTIGHTVIMGRETWESLGSRPLPNRRNIVLSRSISDTPGALMLRSLDSLKRFNPHGPMFAIGGAEIYKLLLPWTTEVLLTVLDREAEGDTFMPEFESEFGPPEILDRADGVEWRRYTRIK